MSRYTYFNIY